MKLAETVPLPMNPFECLGLPLRPWIDPEDLENAFTSRAAAVHPDRINPPAGPTTPLPSAADVAEAYRTLKKISSRLGLLETTTPQGQARVGPVPEPWGGLLVRVGQWAQQCDAWLAGQNGPLTELEKAMTVGEGEALLEEMNTLRQEVDRLEEDLLCQLRDLDAAWAHNRHLPEQISSLRQQFAFAEKIRTRLEERFLRLAEVLT